jgi:NAD(P)H-dependent flavin oxidoreductase YrpB (nitropropane dioxygenase family)
VVEALAAGATGVQVGTAFAYCDESGFAPEIKADVIGRSRSGAVEVFTDPLASPTGFPFKVVSVEDTMSEQPVYEKRTRVCDLGYLRTAYRIDENTVGWRCPSEPVQDYLRKGGDEADTVGRKCVCNGLMASIDLGQTQKSGEPELPLVTSGDDVAEVARFLKPGAVTYSAADVVDYLLQDIPSSRG